MRRGRQILPTEKELYTAEKKNKNAAIKQPEGATSVHCEQTQLLRLHDTDTPSDLCVWNMYKLTHRQIAEQLQA